MTAEQILAAWCADIRSVPIPLLVDVDTAVALIRNNPPQEGSRIAQHSAR